MNLASASAKSEKKQASKAWRLVKAGGVKSNISQWRSWRNNQL